MISTDQRMPVLFFKNNRHNSPVRPGRSWLLKQLRGAPAFSPSASLLCGDASYSPLLSFCSYVLLIGCIILTKAGGISNSMFPLKGGADGNSGIKKAGQFHPPGACTQTLSTSQFVLTSERFGSFFSALDFCSVNFSSPERLSILTFTSIPSVKVPFSISSASGSSR